MEDRILLGDLKITIERDFSVEIWIVASNRPWTVRSLREVLLPAVSSRWSHCGGLFSSNSSHKRGIFAA